MSDLQRFIASLEATGQLARVRVPTDPVLEIAAITDRVCKQPEGGAALLFERPAGSSFPVATNLFGSLSRICLGLSIEHPDILTDRLSSLLAPIARLDPAVLDRQIGSLPDFRSFAPRLPSLEAGSEGMVVMDPPDLTMFPFLHAWPGDGSASGYGRYITLPQVFTVDPDLESFNCGMYRAQIRGPRELAIRWKGGSGAGRHLESFRQRGRKMPVALALGGPPAMTFSAMLPLPGNLDEITFAGFLCRTPLDLIRCRTVPFAVPACCEVVIEGYVEPAETVTEGPFGNHTGMYAPAAPASLMRVTAITHRERAVVPATLVGPPPMEDCRMAVVWERILVSFLRRLFPQVVDLAFPLEWVFQQSAIISLESPRPGMVRETAHALWATPWFAAARLLVFVDAPRVCSDLRNILWCGINRVNPPRGCIVDQTGSRFALDATAGEFPPLERDPRTVHLVEKRWHEYGVELE